MNKQFCIPVSMEITKEQCTEISKGLRELGYRDCCCENDFKDGYNIISNTYCGNDTFGLVAKYVNACKDSYFIKVYNLQLFLALAAQTSNEEFFKDEYVYVINRVEQPKLNNKIFKLLNGYPIDIDILNLDLECANKFHDTGVKPNMDGGYMIYSRQIRKATKEEILNYFNKNNVKEFVLPETYYVKVTKENRAILGAWRFGEIDGRIPSSFKPGCAVGMYRRSAKNIAKEWSHPVSDWSAYGQEITYDQFKTYELKQDTMKKEIIGYKCPSDLFGGEVKKGTVYEKYSMSGAQKNAYRTVNYNPAGYYAMPGEVVETWEPVYKEDKIEIGGYPVEFRSDFIIVNNDKYPKFQIESLKTFFEKHKDIKSLNVGCNGQHKVDLDMINKIYERLITK